MKSTKDTAERIMQACVSLYAEKGVAGLTMRAIAGRAGINPANVYRFFDGKDALLQAIVADSLQQMTEGLHQHLQGIVGARNKLRKLAWFFLHFFESRPEFPVMMSMAMGRGLSSDEGGISTISNLMKDQARILAGIIKEGQQAGEIRPDINFDCLRDIYFGGLERMVRVWLLQGLPIGLANASEEVTKLVFDAIRTQQEESPTFRCPFVEELESLKKAQSESV